MATKFLFSYDTNMSAYFTWELSTVTKTHSVICSSHYYELDITTAWKGATEETSPRLHSKVTPS